MEASEVTQGGTIALSQVSASNSDLRASSVSSYDDDSWFFGMIDYRDNDFAWVKIIHQVPRSEQTTDLGDIIRIENGRKLTFMFIDNSQTQILNEISLLLAQ